MFCVVRTSIINHTLFCLKALVVIVVGVVKEVKNFIWDNGPHEHI